MSVAVLAMKLGAWECPNRTSAFETTAHFLLDCRKIWWTQTRSNAEWGDVILFSFPCILTKYIFTDSSNTFRHRLHFICVLWNNINLHSHLHSTTGSNTFKCETIHFMVVKRLLKKNLVSICAYFKPAVWGLVLNFCTSVQHVNELKQRISDIDVSV